MDPSQRDRKRYGSNSRRAFLSRAGRAGFVAGAMGWSAGAAQPNVAAPLDETRGSISPSNGPRLIDLGHQAELFLHDDHLIAESEGLSPVMGKIEKHRANPVIVADRPWEMGNLGYACVIHDLEEGIYKMWYEARDEKDHGRCLYATSKDGLTWQKPLLNQVEVDGSKQNNIVFTGQRGVKTKVYWVIKDYADPDPEKRYKMMYHLWDFGGRGVGIAHSPDGIRWKASPYVNLHGGFDTQNMMFWESRNGQYVGYFRRWLGGRRYIARATSPDGYHWSDPVVVHGPDEQDPAQWDLYTPGVIKLARARNAYVMVTAAFDWPSNTVSGHLGLSRDGVAWFRFRQTFIPLGEQGAWDHGTIYPTPSDVVVDGRTAIYYSGNGSGHGPGGRPSIGVAFLHEYGFAGWRAEGEGRLTTHLLRSSDNRPAFFINAAVAGGAVGAELLDTDNRPLPGFARDDCREVTGSGARLPLVWKGQDSLGSVLRKGPVRLRIYLRRATVYGFECQKAA